MTQLQELLTLTQLELDIILHGKIEKNVENEPWEDAKSRDRLVKFRFYELQDKYTYGWYIAELDIIGQLRSINVFKDYILHNYKE